ncbi:urease accessory protein UreF [Arhodomonas aquaeolei]|uniref:urease accessory protein UreF n=1 Tax=Arhodomonas aquaeolei TaxID=2369 RepID=UPI00037531CB|nr:urease accessory protein UreF [Arhodomonas aquaeolei]
MVTAITTTTMPDPATLRLWQLISPTLPVGAYAYSAGLETAVADGAVRDGPGLGDWLAGQAQALLVPVDLPALARLMRAWTAGDAEALGYWTDWLRAARETAELRAEDEHMGRALARLLVSLGENDAGDWDAPGRTSWATLFALAASRWDIGVEDAAAGYLWAWLENQVAAGVKLIPLGQSAGQRVLFELGARAPEWTRAALGLADEALGGSAPGVAIASSRHETQYTRLFRS